ncbi:helix-turn-helix transcriptional regulator [Stenotrophomonas maltophilia]|uniref:helix-turn-helix domain-containing protein n=1 Tax=Stenotrophomonas maltophilia TaxID=40324 RepID=UPI000B519CC5|nr:helix-turn-helix transcriptional regulator [Stenotrophomonas maltophilia]ASE53767.1 XRE family transcriptional regulator [Stenotrophomonas maltophilia]HEL5360287.1 helix-turn-helix transcriptional regulator [Stenotrophomonas maltophilia]
MAIDAKSVQKVFGEVLRQTRTGVGLSQQELALRAELDRTYISLLERGKRQPSLVTLLALADAMAIDAAELVQSTGARLQEAGYSLSSC